MVNYGLGSVLASLLQFTCFSFVLTVLLGAPFGDRQLRTLGFGVWMWILVVYVPLQLISSRHNAKQYREQYFRHHSTARKGGGASEEAPGGPARIVFWAWSSFAENRFHAPVSFLVSAYLDGWSNDEQDEKQPSKGTKPLAQDLALAKGIIATAIGAWGGSIFVPLDWDVWWQDWPIPHLIFATLFALAFYGLHWSCPSLFYGRGGSSEQSGVPRHIKQM